jgi:hypothetical protein
LSFVIVVGARGPIKPEYGAAGVAVRTGSVQLTRPRRSSAV